jgi:hypothetical protein
MIYLKKVLVLIESFGSFLLSALLTGIVFAKVSRPTRLRQEIIFSDVAVVNRYIIFLFRAFIYKKLTFHARITPAYIDGSSCLEVGKYVTGKYQNHC